MERIIRFSVIRTQQTRSSFVRYLFNQIDWNERLIGILGSRGSGKTTLLLQHLKRQHADPNVALYMSLDDPYFQEKGLLDIVEDFVLRGGKYIYLDEVHKYRKWSAEIKTLYDTFSDLNIIYTGSSLLEIRKGDSDLSRRAMIYHLAGLSLREFINFTEKKELEVHTLEELITNHEEIANSIIGELRILKIFENYLISGYYPFFIENSNNYHIKLASTVMQVLENDLLLVEGLRIDSVHKLKRFLAIIAEMVPFQPNIKSLSEKLQISRSMIYQFLDYLERSEIINLVFQDGRGLKKLEKPDKIYLQNTNLMYSLSDTSPDKGTLRETFFVNQLNCKHKVTYGKAFDFKIDHKYAAEVGGKNKDQKQIKDIENSFLVLDGIEKGYRNKIPLWMFGLLY